LLVKLIVTLPEQPDAELTAFMQKWNPSGIDPRKKAGLI